MDLKIGQEVFKVCKNLSEKNPEFQSAIIRKIDEFTITLDDGLQYAICHNSAFEVAIPLRRFGMIVYPNKELYDIQHDWMALYRMMILKNRIYSLPVQICRELIKIIHPNYEFTQNYSPKKIQAGDVLYFVPSNPIVCDPRQVMVTKIKKNEILTDNNRSFLPKILDQWVVLRTNESTPIPFSGVLYLSEESYQEHMLWKRVVDILFTEQSYTNINKLPQILKILDILKDYISDEV